MQETDGKWSREDSKNHQGDGPFDYAGRKITKVEASLHHIRVFGRYDYHELEKLGTLENDDNQLKSPNYHLKVIRQIKGAPDFYLSVFVNTKAFFPQCSIEIHPNKDIDIETYKAFLMRLNQIMPNLMVSKVEYVIDHFCLDQASAEVLFWVYMRCLHLGYHKKANIPGADDPRQEGRKMSLVYEIDRHHKVYECGREDKKQDGGWGLTDIDRVRLEHRVDRAKLKDYGIAKLEDLIENPRFTVLNLHRWRFMQFLKLGKLPKFWQPYPNKDHVYPLETPKLEAISPRRKADNVAAYIANYKKLVRIESRVNKAMKAFDWQWYNIK